MKFVCILILFTLVNNLIAELDEYDKQVIINNQLIELAGVQMLGIIRNIVRGPSSMKKMAFMLAAPESENENIEEKLWYQSCLQTEIIEATGINVPEINEGDYENFDLADFGRKRRNMTSPAVKALIRSLIRGDTNFNVDFSNYSMCRLLGLFNSIQHPEVYVDNAILDINRVCFLLHPDMNIIRYKTINGIIWQVHADLTPFQQLSVQIQF
ncbi:uncharacterized protein LOC126840085 isoform X2 [Adelges cooleyi]|uniref:uncharacterized protein LOC126840085 isoform X2 n=1 Tax=Adelges cooleyi TaxID=133065 RepID=UPI0021803426|nr:uncharacterized protein LOC126840085 isoform X2 [Adelges cooleyi]